jgi:hypothetical protein
MLGMVIALWAMALSAADPELSAELSAREVFLGDPVDLIVRIETEEPGWRVEPIELPENLDDATVLVSNWVEEPGDAEIRVSRWILKAQLAWYRLGSFELSPLKIKAVHDDGREISLATPTFAIEIIAMLDEQDQRLAPSKGQVELSIPSLWPYLVAALLVLATLVWIIIALRPKRGKEGKAPPKPLKPPYEEALERLHALTAGPLLKEGRVKEFHVEINAVIRRYYARLFHIHAEEMTSFEVEDWMAEQPHLPEQLHDLNRTFQDHCDRVKFAKHDPVEAENQETVNRAYQIVELLKPKEATDVAAG